MAKQSTDKITSSVDLSKPSFLENEKKWLSLIAEIKSQRELINLGGGKSNIEKQHKKNRLTARERVSKLIDPKTTFFELSQFAAFEMYKEWGGAPSAGTICGIGYVHNRLCMIIANDATVKAGSFFPMTSKKVIRAQTIAFENHLPTIYLVDSAGIFLPLQEDVFPDQDDFGRVFYLNARMSSKGIPQITAIMGMCVAGGAYLPVMTDKILMTEGSGLFLAGPALVKAAIGQEISAEDLGGAKMHSENSGTIDYKEKDDPAAIDHLRKLVKQMGGFDDSGIKPIASRKNKYEKKELYKIVPFEGSTPYDIFDVLPRIIDDAEFVEYKRNYGKTIVCGYAHIGGYPVGIIANQKKHIIKKGQPPQFGGVIYTESAEKAARFIMDCNQNKIPLLFIHDVNGFMVGRDAEYSGIIKAGAKLVNAVSNSVVPKISLIIGGTFGAGNYAMCGKAYSPNFIYAWPSAKYAVMGGSQAANTLSGIKIKQLERQGEKLSEDEKKALHDQIKSSYDHQTDARYAAARLWVDEIILPEETRERLIVSLEAVTKNPEIKYNHFNAGVLQT
ncbi:MAG: acyl-CoA carboxylase subunit beta [Calditrichaeota bacterium]|nr:MAG: acyl-CoA carboxylase subunit beta [Calditrichota bacterium]MBL1204177.1 acyl-CoA carboxylase subunit beta [Calditrichota bacterium]NOG44007.1 acyl-CoA carboxylase subunit beta [Calditrichota bacterium]